MSNQIREIKEKLISLEYQRSLEKINNSPNWRKIGEINESISNLERRLLKLQESTS